MKPNRTHWIVLCVASAALMVAVACSFDDLLKAENPAEIPVDQLNDPRLLQVQLNGVVDAFQNAYTEPIIEWSNFLTDEVLTGLNWEDYARVNQRIASYLEGPTQQIYEELSRSHRMGLNLAERIRVWDAPDSVTDFRPALAKTLVFSGYSVLVWAENMCQTVISPDPDNPSGTVLSQLETFEVALPYLTEGLSTAQTVADTGLANLARTGLARANLGLGRWADAANYASQVSPSTFKWWLSYVNIPGGRNPLQGITHGGSFTHGIHPKFTGIHPSFNGTGFAFLSRNVIAPQTDPRIQHDIRDRTGHNALTPLYRLIQGLRYRDYTGRTIAPASAACPACTGTPVTDTINLPWIARFDTDVLLADYVEAQHHYHEALSMRGINEAAVLAFVNARRAAGNQPAVTVSGQALRTELRNQRARDLFMGGFRLGDLRRWTRFDPGNGPFDAGSYFPTGSHPNRSWGTYGPWTCFPIPIQEYEGNTNLQRPANPNVPPGL
jgi:SusD/RagB-like outer membrane lipoprotein